MAGLPIADERGRAPRTTSDPDAMLAADDRLDRCTCCPRRCGASRRGLSRGACGCGAGPEIARVCLHRGEEPAVSGPGGIANVFFAGCNLRCVHCQNWQISRGPAAGEHAPATLAEAADQVMRLLAEGASTVGFVSTAHVAPQVEALAQALRARGVSAPFVLNTNAYESEETLDRLAGLIDVFLPDFKYADGKLAMRLSSAADYAEVAVAALRRMRATVGLDVELDGRGVARRGLIIRHLVLPGHVENSIECLRTLSWELSSDVWLSLMSQYQPTNATAGDADLARRLRPDEYAEVLAEADRLGFGNGWRQELASAGDWNPDFGRGDPFEAEEASA